MKYCGASREPRKRIIYTTGNPRTIKADCQSGFFAALGKNDGDKEIAIQILDIIDLPSCTLFRPADKFTAEQRVPTNYKQVLFTQDDGIVRDFIIKTESAENIAILEEIIEANSDSTKYICDFETIAKMVKRQNANKKSYYAIEFTIGKELSREIKVRNQEFIDTLGRTNALFSIRTHVEFISYKQNIQKAEITTKMLLDALYATKVIPNGKSIKKLLSAQFDGTDYENARLTETETEI